MPESASLVAPSESSAEIVAAQAAPKGRRRPGAVRRAIVRYVLPELALGLLKLLRMTWRIRETGRAGYDRALAGGRVPVVAFLHGRSFMLLGANSAGRGGRRWFSMCSKSADGDAMARLEERLGYEVVRGSTGRGGVQAIVDMIYAVRERPGSGASLAVDGSRGPRGRVQGGIIVLAQRTGGIVLPVTASASSAWIFKRAWDRTLLAKPFSRVEIVFGEPFEVPAKMTAPEFERLRAGLEDHFVALQAHADQLSGSADTEPVFAATS